MNTARKNQIRTTVLLELNSCFTKLFSEFEHSRDVDDQEFLKQLVTSIRECVEGETKHTAETTFNT